MTTAAHRPTAAPAERAAAPRPTLPAACDADARHVCVVLHDVAPARWDGCSRVIERLREVAGEAGVDPLPLTLLVVPRMHGASHASRHYLRWLQRLAADGHETALHGWTHRDEGPPPRGIAQRLVRGVYTASEGEFAALDRAAAAERIERGLAWMRSQALEASGFVAPAWLLSPGAWQAVAEAGFDYTCTLDRVVALQPRRELRAQSLVFSTRSAWRRAASVAWNEALALRLRRAPLLRFELHPHDADHPAVARCWQRLLAAALRERRPLPLRDVAARLLPAEGGTPPALRAS